jgi:hypothetical protein
MSLSRITVNMITSDINRSIKASGTSDFCECESRKLNGEVVGYSILCSWHNTWSQGIEAMIEQIGYSLERFYEELQR